MSEYQTTGSDIAKLVRKSARSTVHFAFSPAMEPKDSYVALNKRKSASHLHKVARREGPSLKVASGKMKLEGREVCLTCQKEIPALARKFKYFLHENGMSFKVRVLDKDGNLIDTDLEKATRDEDEEETADTPPQAEAAEPPADAAPDAPQAAEADAALREDFDRLSPLITRLQETGDKGANKAIDQLARVFQGFVDAQELDKAGKTLKVLKRKLLSALR